MSSPKSTPLQAPTAVPQARTTARRPSFHMRAIQVAIPTVQTSAYIQSSAATPRYWLDNSAPLTPSPTSPADCVPGHGHPACTGADLDAPATPTQPRVPVSARATRTRRGSVYSTSPMGGVADMHFHATASSADMIPSPERDGGEKCQDLASMESARVGSPADDSGEDTPRRVVKLARRRHGWYQQLWRDADRGHGLSNTDSPAY